MSNLIAIAYPDVETARNVQAELGQLTKEQSIVLDDMVVIERRPDGKVKLHQAVSTAGAGAAGGALWGGLIGLIFLAPLLGMAVGAAAGGAAGALTDVGVDDKFLKDLGQPTSRTAARPSWCSSARARPTRSCRGSRSMAVRSSSPRSTTRPRRACRRRSRVRPRPSDRTSSPARPRPPAGRGGAGAASAPMRRAIEAHLGTEQVGRVIYGAIIGLALVLVLKQHPPSAGAAAGSLIATGVAVGLAELYAEIVGTETRTRHRVEPRRSSPRSADDSIAVFFGISFSVDLLRARGGRRDGARHRVLLGEVERPRPDRLLRLHGRAAGRRGVPDVPGPGHRRRR